MTKYVPLAVWVFAMACVTFGAIKPIDGWRATVFIVGMSFSGALAMYRLVLKP